jgi:membrane protease YdiL (CAAX protease family)
VLYGSLLAMCVWFAGASFHGWSLPISDYALQLVLGIAGTLLVGRGARGWLATPRLSVRGTSLAIGTMAVALVSAVLLGLTIEMSDDLMLLEYRLLPGGLWIALFSIAVLTPLLEEWLFRGAILELLLAVFSRHTAIVVTALLFAFVHLSPPTIVHHGLVGYVCGRVRLGTGSLWPAVACHSAYNAVVVLTTW